MRKLKLLRARWIAQAKVKLYIYPLTCSYRNCQVTAAVKMWKGALNEYLGNNCESFCSFEWADS